MMTYSDVGNGHAVRHALSHDTEKCFDEQFSLAVGAIDYVRGGAN